MAKTRRESKPPTFEQALAELEKIVKELETGDLGLEESLAAYEKGIKALKHCQDILARAEKRIALLSGKEADGQPVIEPVEAPAGPAPEQDEKDAPAEEDPDSSLF